MQVPVQLPVQDNDYHDVGFDDQDLSQHLPFPSPPLDPSPEDPTSQNNDLPSSNLSSLPAGVDTVSEFAVSTNHTLEEDTIVVEPHHERIVGADDAGNTDRQAEIEHIACRLTNQLITFHGCCPDCHSEKAREHNARLEQHVSLAEYLDGMTGRCPDILASTRIAT